MTYAPGGTAAEQPLVSRRPFTVAEYRRMGEVGILSERDRVELIDGEVTAMSPIGSPHAGTVAALTRTLVRAVGDRAVVWVQNPVQLGDRSEPEPDAALLCPRADGYKTALPRADEVLLAIEVADSSLDYDRTVKRPLYARDGIPEMWIVDLTAGKVEVCRGPAPDGYASVEPAGRNDVLTVAALPGVTVAAHDFLD